MSRRLEVLLHGESIGLLSENPDGGTKFSFRDRYFELTPRPVLGQKFEDDLQREHLSRRNQGLPDFFANLIPEGRLREVIEDLTDVDAEDDLALLDFVGEDLPGAVVVREQEGNSSHEVAPEKASPGASLGGEMTAAEEGLRFSLAGVQLKFSMLLREEKLTLPAKGETGEWIVKFDSPTFPSLPENEFSMLSWARETGFTVPECALRPIQDLQGFPRDYAPEDTQVLAIRRYDRNPEGRVHQEDFAQAVGLPPRRKYDHITYEAIARLIRQFVDEEAVDEFIRRLVLVIASGNNDAHLKNWSLIYSDKIRAAWSPLYDQVSTVAWRAPSRELALKLAAVKPFGQIDRAAFERFAEKAEIDTRRVLEQVELTLDTLRRTWREICSDLPLPREHAQALHEHWRNVPLLRNFGPLD